MKTPRSITEVSNVSRIDEMEFKRTYRYIVRELGLEVAPADPAQYVPRFASDLDLPEEVERRARELLSNAQRAGVTSGKSPVGLAAAAIYAGSLLTNHKVTQSDVSNVSDVSEVTIRNRYQELLETTDVPA
jgi:transcription initiation factor TFIIB